MKIAIETDLLAHYSKTGVYFYAQRLLKAAMEMDQSNEYTLVYFGKYHESQNFGLPLENVTVKAITRLPRRLNSLLLRTPFGLPIDQLAKVRPDLFLFPTFARWPLSRTKKSITIIYDTVHADRPSDIKTRHFRRYLSTAVPRAIKKSTKVIAISEHTKQRLIDLYGSPKEKIVVITPAVDLGVFKPASAHSINSVKKKYGIERDYLLYLGTVEPRKNIPGIIRAYNALPEHLRKSYQLVLGGGKGWGDQQIQEAMAQVPSPDLLQIGYVDSSDMAALYSGATVFCFPSLFEGWGMPVLEAMACGAPVITADNSSLPEAGGEAALYVKTGDQDDLNRKLLDLLTDSAERARLQKLGFAQAQKFTWENSAQKLLDVFEEVAQL